MTVHSAEAYIERAVEFAEGLRHEYLDADGNRLAPVTPEQPIMASALEVNTASSAAQPHSAQAKPSKDDKATLASSEPAAAASAAPAPANVKQAAAAAPHDAELAAVAPPRSEIALRRGPQAPSGTVTRRESGELAELRRKLFLTRDRHDGLFDTLAWTRALEKGYEEAWRVSKTRRCDTRLALTTCHRSAGSQALTSRTRPSGMHCPSRRPRSAPATSGCDAGAAPRGFIQPTFPFLSPDMTCTTSRPSHPLPRRHARAAWQTAMLGRPKGSRCGC
ncbi:hypothetical protein FA09DRAFT_134809 [Tilletiopsis washingtonensis]|uniref:Uncharacterized protein n=1 Tax=Tilletiopsis washingtonensis TaxID=58919 RepID=A0A316Z5X8_9BASI|nr:hypothetical protein FA09DRAFT_134809 [Tilletiopsis washingtonensis]PWN95615.1 hypothetical protein FA09DRAFT_134809 [Tilletiopsis washingtonensis]